MKRIEDIYTIKEANLLLFSRYFDILITRPRHAEHIERAFRMCQHALHNDMLEDKQSRWLGFIQGVMAVYDIIDVDSERNISREYYHAVYKNQHMDIPQSVNIMN